MEKNKEMESVATAAQAAEPKNKKSPDWTKQLTAFLHRKAVDVELTFPWAPETIAFPCRLMLTEDETAARLAFYSQPAEAQETGRHKYNVELLSSILDGKPRGLPFFDDFHFDGDYSADLHGWKAALKDYLSGGGDTAELIAMEAVDRYNRMTRPAEFFRTL